MAADVFKKKNVQQTKMVSVLFWNFGEFSTFSTGMVFVAHSPHTLLVFEIIPKVEFRNALAGVKNGLRNQICKQVEFRYFVGICATLQQRICVFPCLRMSR